MANLPNPHDEHLWKAQTHESVCQGSRGGKFWIQSGYLSYGMDQHDTCKNKVETFTDLEQRAVKYFKESGFDKYGGEDKDILQPPKVNGSKNDNLKRQ